MSVPLPVPAGPPVPLAPVAPAVLPVVAMAPVALPPEAARGVPPQEWALVRQRVQRAQRVEAKRLDLTERRSASTGCLGSAAAKPRPGHLLQHAASSDSVASSQGDSVDAPLSPGTPESPDSHVQIFEFLKTNCRTEEYVDKIVPSIVEEPRRLKDVPDVSRTLTRLPEGFTREKDILEDLGHKSLLAAEEVDESADEAAAAAEAVRPAVRLGQGLAAVPLPANLLRYLDESRCSAPPPPGRRRSSMSMSLSALSQRLPLPSHLRKLTVKNIKLSLGKLCRRRTVVITESDPSYKVAYLGNVLTGWAKGEGCAEKPLSTLWKNYTASNKPDVNMKVAVTRSGLKATTREHGLTEYWSHRITHCAAPPAFPRVFCWVYRHEGRKLKQELRCHAVLCAREDQARRMAQQLTERLALALLEFRRDKQSREQARLSLANALHDNPSLPQRKLLLSTGASNYRPPLERSKSAPKLGSIEEVAEEDEAGDVYVFGHPRAVKRFLRDERLAAMRRQHFRESLRRKLASARNAEEPEEPEDPMRHDPRHEVLTVVRVNSIEEEPDPEPEALPAEVRDAPLRVPPPPPSSSSSSAQQQQQQQQPQQPSARARAYLLDVEDAAESDEGSSSLQSISSDGTTCGAACGVACGAACTAHSHSRTDSGEDFCLGADAATSDGLTRKARHRDDREDREEAWDGDRDDFDDNVSDESGYVEAPSEALALALSRRTATGRIAADLKGVKSCKGDRDQDLALAKACAEACTLREGRAQSLQGRQGLQV